MEFEHFSHNHGLIFNQMPPGSEINCSGCKSPGSGRVYVCWQCSYFLHEQCFLASRSLKHPSHTLHTLTLMPSPTFPSGSFSCDSCSLVGEGFSYSCSECEFDMHVHCALRPNAKPPIVSLSSATAPNFSIRQNPINPPTQNNTFPLSNMTLPNKTHITSYPPNQNKSVHSFPQPNPLPPSNYCSQTSAPYPNPPPPPTTNLPAPPSESPPTPIGYPPSIDNHFSNYPIPPTTNNSFHGPTQQIPPPPPNYIPPMGAPYPNPPSQPTATVRTCSTNVSSTTVNLPFQPTATIMTCSTDVSSTIINPPLTPPSGSSPTPIGYPLSSNPIPNYSSLNTTLASETHVTIFPPNTNNSLQPSQQHIPQPQPNYSPPVSATYPNPPSQPTAEVQTYDTVMSSTITSPPLSPPPPSSPIRTRYPDNNPQSKTPPIIKHFSHPHVLKALEFEGRGKKNCSACDRALSGSTYCCTKPYCKFKIHKTCFESPLELHHKSHLGHPLKLITAPPYEDEFTCDACLKNGKAFAYTCTICSYYLHIDCISWPETISRSDHEHDLTLYYSSPLAETSPDVTFMCDVCKNPMHEMAWMYYCHDCDFGTHLECVTSEVSDRQNEEEVDSEIDLESLVLKMAIEAQGRKAALALWD